MARIAAALGVVSALLAGTLFSLSTEYHRYTVTFVLDKDGNIRAEKEPGVFFFEIDYGWGTDFTFVNNTGVNIDVQFQEAPSRSTCHVQFSPAGSVFCESQVMPIDAGGTAPLRADALDLKPWDYCWSFSRCPGDVKVGRRGQVLLPVDPDLQIERDFLYVQIVAALLSLGLFAVAYLKRRRGRAA